MAALQKKGEHWYCTIRYLGNRHTFTIGKVTDDEAQAKGGHVDLILMRLKQRLLTLPENMSITEFLLFDGKTAPAACAPTTALSIFRDKYGSD